MKCYSPNIKNKERILALMIPIQNVFEVPHSVIKQGKKIKGIQTGKEEVKPPSRADNMTIYTKNSRESTKKRSQNSLSEFSKVSMQVSIIFQYTSNK